MKASSFKPIISICTYEERQLMRKNAPQVSIRIQSEETAHEIPKADIKKTASELPQKKKAPPPPPPTKKVEKQVSFAPSLNEPMPDYDSPDNTLKPHGERPRGTMGRMAMQEAIKANGDLAELESIESFKINNSNTNQQGPPVPPPMYFSTQKSGPPTMKKLNRPVQVACIINSYDDKKEPGKFNFIDATDGNANGFQRVHVQEDMSTRLKNELEKTLSRSNLRRRTDGIACLL